jgi:hypothetical protein
MFSVGLRSSCRSLLIFCALPAALTAQVNLLSTPFVPVGSGPRNIAAADLNADGKADMVAANSLDGTISVLLSNGDGTFRPAVKYVLGGNPNDVAIADFNGDGKPDLAVANSGTKVVSVLLGNGDGTFQAAVNYSTSDFAFQLVAADFNGDGKLDIATTDFSGGVSILLGNGDGTFQAEREFSTGIFAGAIAVADFNLDGKPDLAVVNNNGENLTIFLGNGDGTFTQGATYTPSPYTPPTSILGVAVADVNLDGKPDLLLSNPAPSSTPTTSEVTVMLGNGDGTFAAPISYGATTGPYSLVVADFNGDGKPDVAVANQGTNSVSVLTGNGDGTFTSSYQYAAGIAAEGIAAGDFNGDGKIDLATANYETNDASILLGNGVGSFRGAPQYQSPVSPDLLLADLNHDGKLDAVFDYGVMLGNGNGTFQPPTAGVPGVGVAVADFNNDGNLDLAGATGINSGLDNQLVAVVLGNGDGTFQSPTYFSSNFLGPAHLVAADFSGDGNTDLVITGGDIGSIALGNGTGSFQPRYIIGASGVCCQTAAADFNRDGNPDVIAANGTNTASLVLFLGNGDGTFQTSLVPGAPDGTAVAVADFNGDGIPDVVVVGDPAGGPAVLLGNGDGTFAPAVYYTAPGCPQSVATGDINQDGRVDLVVGVGSGRVAVLLGNGDGTFQPAIPFGSALSTGSGCGAPNETVAVGDVNGDGYPDVLIANDYGSLTFGSLTVLLNQGSSQAVASIVGLSSSLNPAASGQSITLTANVAPANDGSAMPTGTITFRDGSASLGTVALNSGTAGLSVANFSAGSHNLTAVYSGNIHFTGSTSAPLVQVVNSNPFTVTASGSASASISIGQMAQYQLTLTPGTAQNQTVSLSCSGAPPSSTCAISPTSVALSGTSAVSLAVTVQTSSPYSALALRVLPNRTRGVSAAAGCGWKTATFVTLLPGMMLAGILLGGPKRKPRRAGKGLLFCLLLLLTACGGNSGPGNIGTGAQGTPAGAYTVKVTAQSSTAAQQILLSLTVNP